MFYTPYYVYIIGISICMKLYFMIKKMAKFLLKNS